MVKLQTGGNSTRMDRREAAHVLKRVEAFQNIFTEAAKSILHCIQADRGTAVLVPHGPPRGGARGRGRGNGRGTARAGRRKPLS